jgi:hypothetical protein
MSYKGLWISSFFCASFLLHAARSSSTFRIFLFFAIPSHTFAPVLKTLIKKGRG